MVVVLLLWESWRMVKCQVTTLSQQVMVNKSMDWEVFCSALQLVYPVVILSSRPTVAAVTMIANPARNASVLNERLSPVRMI